MFQSLHAPCKGHDGAHSSQPTQEEESQTCAEPSRTPTESHKHTPVSKHTSVPSHTFPLCSELNKSVCEHASRPHAEGAVKYLKKNIKTLKEQLRAVRTHIEPQEGAITLLGELQAGPLIVQGGMSASLALPITAVRPRLDPVADHAQQCQTCGASDWVIRTVARQFASTPPHFNGVVPSHAWGDRALVLKEKLPHFRARKLFELCRQSRARVVLRGGGLQPILNLRALNKHTC